MTTLPPDHPLPVVRIRPASGWSALELGAVWEYRELLYYMVWRDIKVRYKQTMLGVGLAVVQPVASTIIFTVIFGQLAALPSEGVPYPVFAMAALLPWQLFSSAFSGAANSVVGNAGMISKVYFPRLVVPLAAVGASLVDFGVSFVLLIGLMLWYGVAFSAAMLWLPLLAGLAVTVALAAGLWVAALNVQYRDVRYLLPFLLQLWLFLSPVAYSVTLVPERYQALYALNPMVGIIQGFRWALFNGPAPWTMLATTVVASAVVLVGGLFYFRRAEQRFIDVI